MKKLNLQSIIRKKRKYSSCKGQIGKIVDNHIKRNFEATAPNPEMFYEQEEKYKTLEELKEAIENYIYYYNNKRIKEKLKGLTPASYRSQSLLVS